MSDTNSRSDSQLPQEPTPNAESPHLVVARDDGYCRVDHATPEADRAEAGFDLTNFATVNTFSDLLRANDLEPGSNPDAYFDVIDKYVDDDRTHVCYVWSNPEVALITGNDPLSGVYSNPEMRTPEPGYASYIGVSGLPDAVDALTTDIADLSVHIKGRSTARDYI